MFKNYVVLTSFYKKGTKMKVYFENSRGKKREIGQVDSEKKSF